MSYDDITRSQLYFGNTSHVYSYSADGVLTTVRNYSDNTLGTWTVNENMLYYTSELQEFSLSQSFNISMQRTPETGRTPVEFSLSQSFNISMQRLEDEAIPSLIGTVKAPFPEDIKVVSMTRAGMKFIMVLASILMFVKH